MKDFRGMKRQRSRNRKPAGNSNNPNRAYESNGPEGTKARGNAQTIYEKYQQLARDANSAGDRVLAENHLQHAEHYFRMIRQMQPTRPVSEFVQRDPFSSGFDDDYDDVEVEATETETEAQGDDQPSDEPRYENRMSGERDNRNRDRDNRNNGDRNNRNFKDRMSGERDNRNNGDRNEQQFDENGNRRETRRERYERRRQQRFAEQEQNLNAPVNVSAPAAEYVAPSFIASTQPLGARPAMAQPVTGATDLGFEAPAAEAPVKEKRERPERKPRANASGTASDDASQLPAFLHRPAPVAAEADAAPEAEAKPKRTRKKKEDASASEEA
jgi:hypothetical protein